MPQGEKTKLLWQNPEYRKYMSDAHKGKSTWNKGLKEGKDFVNKGSFKKGHLFIGGEKGQFKITEKEAQVYEDFLQNLRSENGTG